MVKMSYLLSIFIVVNLKIINAVHDTNNVALQDGFNNINNNLHLSNFKDQITRPKRSLIQDDVEVDKITGSHNNSEEIETTAGSNMTEECVGDKQFCNLTKEDYFAMLNDYIYPQTYEWVLIATHTAVFIIGLVGNTLVCVAVYKNHTMRTVTNYFLVNLAVADFMVLLFCLPATVVWDVTETWFLGNALCKILLYFQVR